MVDTLADKRVFDRYKVNFKSYIVLPDDVHVYEAQLLDLSLSGMRLQTEAPVAPGQVVNFSFTSKPPVKGKARVVWCHVKGRERVAGLEIVQLSPKFRKALQEVVNELTLGNLSDSYLR